MPGRAERWSSFRTLCGVALLSAWPWIPRADERTDTAVTAWQRAADWRNGDDVAALLAIEQEGFASTSDPVARAAHAARLAALLADESSTPDTRLWACLQLRFTGTAAEVPLLAPLLTGMDAVMADAARQAIEGIPHPAAAAALRAALPLARGPLQAGVAAAVGRRRDTVAVPLLVPLALSADAVVADAAAGALASIGGADAIATLEKLAESAGRPTPTGLAAALLRVAESTPGQSTPGRTASRDAMRRHLAETDQPAVTRQAAYAVELAAMEPLTRAATILDWLAGVDPDRAIVACGRLADLDEESLVKALSTATTLPPASRLAVVSAAARRRSSRLVPHLLDRAHDPFQAVRVAAVEGLGLAASPQVVPVIIAASLSDESDIVREAARGTLVRLPKRLVSDEVLAALAAGPTAAADLARVGGPAACKLLSELVVADEEAAALAAVAGLEKVLEPTADAFEKLVAIYAAVRNDERRDAVARAIARLAYRGRSHTGFDPAAVVLTALDRTKLPAEAVLPLAGRIGGARVRARIDAGLASDDAATREAALAGLCHWPTAEVADRLAAMADKALGDSRTREAGRRALRAHVRLISLPSDRSAADTLAALQAAMRMSAAGDPEDRGFVLERTAAAVRTMPAVDWITGYLDGEGDGKYECQAACRALLSLAHHRFLRQPNAGRFDTILDRVALVTDDPALADRALRYKAGL